MERVINSVFAWKGKHYQVKEVEDEQCEGCAFEHETCTFCSNLIDGAGFCSCNDRADHRSIIFKEVDHGQKNQQ